MKRRARVWVGPAGAGRALALGLAALALGCSGQGSDSASRTDAATLNDSTPRVRLATVAPAGDAAASFATYLEAEREAELVAETDGDVVDLRVRPGQRVAPGDTLLVIDDRDEQLTLQRDEAEHAWALSQVRRLEALEKQRHVSAQEVEQARLQLDRAAAALGLSQVALSRCAVRAPIAGLAWMIRVEPLHHVARGQPLLRVTDPDRLRASAYLPAAWRGEVRVGTRVRLAPIRAGGPIDAVVSRVDPLTDPASGTFKAVATFRRRSSHPEAGAEVRFVLSRSSDTGCLVPLNTLVEAEGDSTYVWRLDGDRVRRCPVRIGPVRRDALRIESGLASGRVVTGSDRPLRDGVVVEVVEAR